MIFIKSRFGQAVLLLFLFLYAYVLSSYCFYQGFVRYRLCGKAGLHEPVK